MVAERYWHRDLAKAERLEEVQFTASRRVLRKTGLPESARSLVAYISSQLIGIFDPAIAPAGSNSNGNCAGFARFGSRLGRAGSVDENSRPSARL
jgi:hypothetical protein